MKSLRMIALMMLLTMGMAFFAGCGGEKEPAATPDNTAAQTAQTAALGLREPVNGETYKIGIVMKVENGAFLDMKDGIIKGLAQAGLEDGKNMTIDYQNAQGDDTNLATICQGMADGSYDLVFTIATPATQQFVNLGSATPCIFCSVAAPIQAGVMAALDQPDMNATGTSNAIPAGDILELAFRLTPDTHKVGLLYCTSEVNAVSTMEAAKAYLEEQEIAYEEVIVANSAEVQTAAQTLISDDVDAMFIANDSVVQSAVDLVVELCNANDVPTYCCSATTVQSGCLATLAMSDQAIGEQTAALAMEYLGGKEIADIPCVVVPADYISINQDTMQALGIQIPEDLGEVQYLSAQ